MTWTEEGGPPVEGPPERQGFGTTLIDRLFSSLGGSIEREWRREGLIVRIVAPSA